MPDRRRYGRTPDTIFILGACSTVGTVLTLTGHVPSSVLDIVSITWGLAWSALFSFSATLALIGVMWRDPLTGWLFELAGRFGLACTSAGYVVALRDAATQPGTALIVAIVAGISAASGWRVYQLTRRLGQFRASLERAGR